MRFGELINEDFWDKYGEQVPPDSGIVGKDGRVNYDPIYRLYNDIDGENHPYRFLYAVIHGQSGLMGMWETPAKFRGHEEKIYKMCLDKGETWKELLSYEEPGKDVLL